MAKEPMIGVEHLIRRVASEHSLDPRTLKKRIAGQSVRGLPGERAERAYQHLLKELRDSGTPIPESFSK